LYSAAFVAISTITAELSGEIAAQPEQSDTFIDRRSESRTNAAMKGRAISRA
jgi:hypothetical protein